MEQYLRAYVSYQQDDWPDWLPIAEFVGNNTVSETTKVTPVFANKGYHPRMGFEPVTPVRNLPQQLAAEEFASHMERLNDNLGTEMRFAQAQYETTANRHRAPAPVYPTASKVWLNTRNLHTKRPSKKLDSKRAGPFTILQQVSPYAYKLDLPASVNVHPVFHVNLLEPVALDAHPGHYQPPPPPVKVDGHEENQVGAIVDSVRVGRGVKYLVKWVGWPNSTLEPWEFVCHLDYDLTQFELRYPDKPRHGLRRAQA